MTAPCATCRRPLDYAAVLCDKATCTSCEIERLRKPNDEWSFFLRTIRSCVRDDCTLHVNDVRPLIRGKVEPKHIGTYFRRAQTLKLIAHHGWEDSSDTAGRNADKQARVWRWTAKAGRAAA